jgi:hypothetical protein
MVYTVSSQLLGSGIIGGAVSAALAGSVVKGQAGDTIATIAGFTAAMGFNPFTALNGAPEGGLAGMEVM